MSKSKGNAEKLKSLQAESKAATDAVAADNSIYRHHLRTTTAATDAAADGLVKQANKTLRKLFSGSEKYEQAADLLTQAGAAYRLNDNFTESAEAYTKAAELYEAKVKNTVEACVLYVKAARSYREIDIDKSLDTFKLAVALHMENGRHESAARIYVDMAEIEEQEGRIEGCMEYYESAINCFESTDMLANAVQIYGKLGALYIGASEWLKAGDTYEKCASVSSDKGINRGTIHEYYYLALLCYFVYGAIVDWSIDLPQSKYRDYTAINRRFEGTREFALLKRCFECWEDEDVKGLTKAIFEYDKLKNIDDRESQCWLKIKQALRAGPPEAAPSERDANEDYT